MAGIYQTSYFILALDAQQRNITRGATPLSPSSRWRLSCQRRNSLLSASSVTLFASRGNNAFALARDGSKQTSYWPWHHAQNQ